MKKNMLFVVCIITSQLAAQDLSQALGVLKTSLDNLGNALSGKTSRELPLLPDQEAAKLLQAPFKEIASFKNIKGTDISGWYGIIKDGPMVGQLGIYTQVPKAGTVTMDSFFAANGSFKYPWESTSVFKLYSLYDPKSLATQNASAKQIYEQFVPPVQKTTSSTPPIQTITPSGPVETDMKKLFEEGGFQTRVADEFNKRKFTYGIVKGKKQLGAYIPAVVSGTTVLDFFDKQNNLVYPDSKQDKTTANYQMFILYDANADQTSQNMLAKGTYDKIESTMIAKKELMAQKKAEEEEEEEEEEAESNEG